MSSLKDVRQEYYDESARARIVLADATDAAQRLALGHLSGPAATAALAEHLAVAAVLGAETSLPDETLILQVQCSGPLGGITAECTAAGTLRGFTVKKTLDEFDCLEKPDMAKLLGKRIYQVTRSVPGRILSQGGAASLDGYFADSLQRNAAVKSAAAVSQEVEVLQARAVLLEIMPDSPCADNASFAREAIANVAPSASARTILKKLGFPNATLKRETPLAFACRCSQERAQAMFDALAPEDRAGLPDTVAVTCHMCGKSWFVTAKP